MDFKFQLAQARQDGILEGYKKIFREYTYHSILNGEYMDEFSRIASEKLNAYNGKKNIVTNWFWTLNFTPDVYLPDLLETLQEYLFKNLIFNRFQLAFEVGKTNGGFHCHILSNADTRRGLKYYVQAAYTKLKLYLKSPECIQIDKIKKLDVKNISNYLLKVGKEDDQRINDKMRKLYSLKSIYRYPDPIWDPHVAKIRV